MTHASSDNHGLICAFALGPVTAHDHDLLGTTRVDRPHWLHLNLVDTRARRWIEGAGLPDEAREVLLEPAPLVHGQPLPDAVLIVLQDIHHDFKGDPESVGPMVIYLEEQRVITGRRHALMSLDRMRRKLLAGMQVATASELFEEMLQTLAESFGHLVGKLGDEIDDAEDKILAGELHDQGARLGRMRRTLARFRRHVRANRAALATVVSHPPRWCDADDRVRLQQALERVDAIAQDIELCQERTRLLQEEIAGRLGEATNRNLFFLSIVTATLLPVTLITGIFGMNVGGLPFLNDPGGFAWVTGIMIGAVVAVLLLLRRRRIF
ncbi:MAG TPA: CorA family divalent cation transporter [Polyangia bacterium]|jgi:zinc transporter